MKRLVKIPHDLPVYLDPEAVVSVIQENRPEGAPPSTRIDLKYDRMRLFVRASAFDVWAALTAKE